MAEVNNQKTILKRDDDGTITLSITIPHAKVQKAWEEQLDHAALHTTLPGFREGKAPKKLVLEKLDREKVKEEVLKKLLPNSYMEAVKELNLNPIINPKIHVDKLEDPSMSKDDWT